MTWTAPPTSTLYAGIVFTAVGGRFAATPSPTVTLTFCAAAAPSGSRAVKVTTAVPSATPVIVADEPSMLTVAAASFEDPAEKVSASPSASLK